MYVLELHEKAFRMNLLWTESDGFRNGHEVINIKKCVRFTKSRDPKAICTRYSPLYLFRPDSSENIDMKESNSQRENNSKMSAALRIVFSCGQHHGG